MSTAAVSIARPFSPCDEITQLGSAIDAFFASLCERGSSAFRRVEVNKLDERGTPRVFEKVDPDTGQTQRITSLFYIEDIRTGKLYQDEPQYIVAVKCFLIFTFVNPIYTFSRFIWHTTKTPLEVGAIALVTLKKIGEQLIGANMRASLRELGQGISSISSHLFRGIYDIVKTPLFGLGVQLASLYGIFKPYHGRKIEALIEQAWQSGVSYKVDFRNIPAREEEGCLEACVKDVQMSRPFYLAYCFQVRGDLSNRNIAVVNRLPI